MIYYHGTTLEYARAIKREGLKPSPDREFIYQRDSDLLFGDPISLSQAMEYHYSATSENAGKMTVFLTKKEITARAFASFRAMYERADYGDKVPWSHSVKMYKLSRSKDANAVPAIIVFDIPFTFASNIIPDEQTSGYADYMQGFKCHCTVPSEYVINVKAIPEKIYDSSDWQ